VNQNPVFQNLTVLNGITTRSLTSQSIISQDILTSNISTNSLEAIDSTLQEVTLTGTLSRSQNSMVMNSFEAQYTIIPPYSQFGDPIPLASLNTPHIGPFPGFVGGVMNLTGQTGFLSLDLWNTSLSPDPVVLQVVKSGVISQVDLTPNVFSTFATLSRVLPIRTSDTYVMVSVITVLPGPSPFNIALSVGSI
jgi:hypothetical protein